MEAGYTGLSIEPVDVKAIRLAPTLEAPITNICEEANRSYYKRRERNGLYTAISKA